MLSKNVKDEISEICCIQATVHVQNRFRISSPQILRIQRAVMSMHNCALQKAKLALAFVHQDSTIGCHVRCACRELVEIDKSSKHNKHRRNVIYRRNVLNLQKLRKIESGAGRGAPARLFPAPQGSTMMPDRARPLPNILLIALACSHVIAPSARRKLMAGTAAR